MKATVYIRAKLSAPPHINSNGTVTMTCVVPLSNSQPKRIQRFGETVYIVHATLKMWKRVQSIADDKSTLLLKVSLKPVYQVILNRILK